MIIDSHCNLGKSVLFPHITENYNSLMNKLAKYGVSKAVVGPFGKDLITSIEQGNKKVAYAIKRNNNLIGIAGANPWSTRNVERLTYYINNLGFKGIKLNPSIQGFMVNSKIVEPIIEIAKRFRVPVMIHSGTPIFSLPLNIGDLADRYPDVTFIMAHMGFSDFFGDAIIAAKLHENIILETSLMPVVGMIERAINEIGSERIMFGSSSPNGDLNLELFKIFKLNISEEDRIKILGGNAKRVFKVINQ
jgi:predicted TIM-barrel fold metal-dependent hydrolase